MTARERKAALLTGLIVAVWLIVTIIIGAAMWTGLGWNMSNAGNVVGWVLITVLVSLFAAMMVWVIGIGIYFLYQWLDDIFW